jgi:four helix bundle protein
MPNQNQNQQHKFIALEVAEQLVHVVRPLVEQIARRDRDLAVQGRKAGSSILLNICEGNRRVGKDRLHFFRIAAGSAGELDGILITANAWGYLACGASDEARRVCDRLLQRATLTVTRASRALPAAMR